MPVGLLSIFLTWAATHLVVFSMLGFLFSGLILFGAVELPGGNTGHPGHVTTEPATPAVSAPHRDSPASRPSVPVEAERRGGVVAGEQTPTATGQSGRELPIGRKTPKLIGGSLPVYEVPGAAPSRGQTYTAGGDGAFRPPADGVSPEPAEAPRDELVQQARRAFWNGDFEAAEKAYMVLLSAYPGDADGFGELGNLYQSMGKPAEALDAFYEAGVRLKAAGETEKLQQIIELLTQEGDKRADQLLP